MDKVKFNDKQVPILDDFTGLGTSLDNAIKEVLSKVVTDRDIVIKGLTVTQTTVPSLGVSVNVDGTAGYGMAIRSNGDIIKVETNTTVAIASNSSGSTRIDIIIAKESHVDAAQEYRYLRTSSTGLSNTLMYTELDMTASLSVVQGTPGSGVAPATTAGYIKLAEVTVASGAASIVNANIKDASATSTWTTSANTTAIEHRNSNYKNYCLNDVWYWGYGSGLVKATKMSLDSSGNLAVAGNLTVTGNISGSMTSATITTAGITTANITTLNVSGNSLLTGTLGVANTINATKASGTGLAVTANATVGGTLGVTGVTTLGTASITTANITTLNMSGLTASKIVGTDGSKNFTTSVSTDLLTEGTTNLYYTTARAIASISAGTLTALTVSGTVNMATLTASKIVGTDASKNLTSTVTTDHLTEGSTNLYYTTARALSSVSGGTLSGLAVTGTITFNSLTANYAVTLNGSKQLTSTQMSSSNIISTIVVRDGSGNFSAGTITATLSGNASTSSSCTGNAATSSSCTGNAVTVTNGVYTTGSYANPSWLTSIAGSKITGSITMAASFMQSYATAPNSDLSNYDVSGINVLFLPLPTSDRNVYGFSGGSVGQQLMVIKNCTNVGGRSWQIRDGYAGQSQPIKTGGDYWFGDEYAYMLLVFNGSQWIGGRTRPINH